MAGHRRSSARRGPDGRILPLSSARRANRIRACATSRYAAAQTERDRLAAATDYVRSAAAAARRAGLDPSPLLAEATRQAMATGDALTELLAGNRTRGRRRSA